MELDEIAKVVADYALEHYLHEGMCSLCGNRGVINTIGVRTPAGFTVGRLNYCICPNGQAMRRSKADMMFWLTDHSQDIVRAAMGWKKKKAEDA